MNCKYLMLIAAAFHLTGAGNVRAQDEEDRELRQMDSRLQEQRAVAARTRLMLYSDELRKLQSQYTATGEATAAVAVQKELDAVALAVKRLAAIARGQAGPPESGELKEDEKVSDAALAAKRIDAIIAKFSQAKGDGPAARNAQAGQMRARLLKIERASKNPGFSQYEGSSYWAYDSSYAVWTLDDLAPGEYEIVLRYSGSAVSGGKAVVKAAGQKFEVTVPRGEKGGRKELTLSAGNLKVKEGGVDVRVESGGLAARADCLWNLHAVALVPAGKRP